MSGLPTTAFDLDRVRDLSGRHVHVWYRRVVLALLLAFVLVALSGTFGQVEHTNVVSGPAGTLTVRLPHTVRGGLLVPVRIQVDAKQKIVSPQIVLGAGFAKGMQINTLEPGAASETSRHGAIALTYATLDAGDSLTVYVQLQVDPTTVGDQDGSVSIEGANAAPLRIPATIHVLP